MSGKLTLGLDAGHVRIWTTSMKQHVEAPYVLTKTFVQPYLKGFLPMGCRWIIVYCIQGIRWILNLQERALMMYGSNILPLRLYLTKPGKSV